MPPRYSSDALYKTYKCCNNPECPKTGSRERVKLSQCARCELALYCSKECQTAAWQDHKHFCRLNSRPPVSSNQQEALKRLHAFCAKHKPSLSAAAIVALELCRDRTRPLRDCVHICVTEVPNATCPEQSFKALSAEIVPFEFFGPEEGEEFRSQIRDSASYSQRIGHAGCFMVIVSELGRFNISTNIIEHFREEEIPASTTGVSWERLINLLNSGTVV